MIFIQKEKPHLVSSKIYKKLLKQKGGKTPITNDSNIYNFIKNNYIAILVFIFFILVLCFKYYETQRKKRIKNLI